MTAEEIRNTYGPGKENLQDIVHQLKMPTLQVLVLAEIAAQLAELVELAKPTKIIGGPSDE